MTYRIEFSTLEESKNLIEDFVKNVHYATPFHTYNWLSALQENMSAELEIAEFYKDRECVGICPLFKKKLGFFEVFFSPVFATETAYMGILGADIDGMLESLKKEVKNFFMVLPPEVMAGKFLIENKETIITELNCRNAEEHFAKIRKGHRYDTRKAEKEGVVVKEDYSAKAIREYYEILKRTYSKSEYRPMPENFYVQIIEELHKKNRIKFLLAAHEGKTIAGAIFLILKDKMYYWTGGSVKEPEYAKLYPNNLLQWEIIKFGYENGIKNYDMLGASVEGIKNFKLGWGGEIKTYQRVYSSRYLKLLADTYNKFGASLKEIVRKTVR